jgi:hypothetical protein
MEETIEPPPASEAAVRLFACISRFEFALKEANYVAGEEGRRASPDWNRFERDAMKTDILDRIRVSGAAAELLGAPPCKQLRHGDMVTWSAPLVIETARDLCVAVRQVRNNLFHGGKSGADPRDDQLCADATTALLALLDINPRLRDAFLGLY